MIQFQLPLLLCVVVVEWYNDVESDKLGRAMKEADCVFDVLPCYKSMRNAGPGFCEH